MSEAKLFDTHCHIHSADYKLDAEIVYKSALEFGVAGMICVGTDSKDSLDAISFATTHKNCWATVGLHPHEASKHPDEIKKLANLAKREKVVAIGECGLDYYYLHSPKIDQEEALRKQIEIAIENNLALVFHVREAFADFWRIFDDYSIKRAVVHSFTGSPNELEQILARDLYIGINGIMTFSKDVKHKQVASTVPINKIVLETDSPFLTPVPLRGKVNEPRYVEYIAKWLADLRREPLSVVKKETTDNVKRLFQINLS